jgi:4Fe-4S ferredoxin
MTASSSPAKSSRARSRHARLLAAQKAKPPRCKAEPGVFKPIVDPLRCEGKGDCAVACRFGVFEIGRMPGEQFAAMPLLVKFKLWAHGRKTAFTFNAHACRACGSCVSACPEHAIKLARSVKPQ